MPIQKNLNVSPYYDDFDANKNFYKVLYKAGFPIQARELTTSQSILQDQVEKLASRILREGDNVVPGEFSMANPAPYVRLSSFTRGAEVSEFIGYEATGVVSGVVATINFAVAETDDDDTTLYVQYKGSGSDGTKRTFVEGETLEINHPNNYTAVVGVNGESSPTTSEPMGLGTLFTVTGGSYFIDGFIVRNDEQTITLNKYDTDPTFRVGFLVNEEVVTSSDDASLLDNAQGSNNFAAPGADRLKITLTLAARTEDDADPNFVLLANIEQGSIVGNGEGETVKWDWLYDILARRTDDESGDYIVKDFKANLFEYVKAEGLKGKFEADDDGLYPPVPGFDDENAERLTIEEAGAKYAVRMSSGKAYVNGYPVDYEKGFWLYGNKARDEQFLEQQLTPVGNGQAITISNVSGMPDVQNLSGDGTTRAFDHIELYRNFIDGHVGQASNAGVPLNSGNAPWKTYHIIADGDLSSGMSVGGVAVNEVYREGRSAVVNSVNAITRGTSIGGRIVLVALEIDPIVAGVIRPRHLMPANLIDTQDGFYGYNSTYTLGLLDSVFFDEITIVPVANEGTDWVVGDIVTGQDSDATGVVEASSTNKRLVLSDVQGAFLPEEKLVQGSKVSRVIAEGELLGFQFTDKGTANNVVDLSSQTAVKLSALGATTQLTVAAGEIEVFTDRIEITKAGRTKLEAFPYPNSAVGLGRDDQRLNYAVETVPGGVKGYGITQTPVIDGTSTITKAFHSSLADVNDFSADIAIQQGNDVTTRRVAGNSTFTGNKNENFITCNSQWGDPTRSLVEGDLVTFTDNQGNEVNKIVQFATKPAGYGERRVKAVIYFTTALANDVKSSGVEVVRLKPIGQSDDNFLMELPAAVVKTLETKPNKTGIEYEIFRQFVVNVSAGSTEVAISTTNTNEQFLGLEAFTSVVVAKNISQPNDPAGLVGRALNVDIDVSQDSGKKAVYTFTGGAISDTLTLKIIVPVSVINAKAKRKLIQFDHVIDVPMAEAQAEYVSLGKPDVYGIKSIILDPDGRNIDVTKEYEFDNGQRDNMYDIAKIKLRTGKVFPNGDLRITYDYFEHSGDGDFFSVDSYTSDGGTGFEAIPYYTSTTGFGGQAATRRNPIYVNLRNTIDFRPVVNSETGNPSVYPRIAAGRTAQNGTNFVDSGSGGNAFVPRMPLPQTTFECDMTTYLGRIDSIFIDQGGGLTIVEGEPSDDPQPVPDISTGIRLYDIPLPPYTFNMQTVNMEKFDYKRYQMKDIASLERRIQRMEEAVTLNMLEQNAINVEVKDAVTGLDRFKNGIITDTFIDHSRGDTAHPKYQAAIDPDLGILRAPTFSDQIEMEDSLRVKGGRAQHGYAVNNDIATIDFEVQRWKQQPVATRHINLQPYSVFTYEGVLDLTPSIDTWVETREQPDLVIRDNAAYNAVRDMSLAMRKLNIGTVWGDWKKAGKRVTGEQTRTWRGGKDGFVNHQQAVLAGKAWLKAQGFRGEIQDRSVGQQGAARFLQGRSRPLKVITRTSELTSIKRGTQTSIEVGTKAITKTSYGERVTDVSIQRTMRSRIVYFQAYRLKPNTEYFAFFDDVDVTNWVSIDSMRTDEDGDKRYVGKPNQFRRGFGFPLMSDDVGTMTGCFLVPNGYSPRAGQQFTGSVRKLSYYNRNSGNGYNRSLKFNTGESMLRFTTSSTNAQDPELIDGFAEAEFTSSGMIQDKQETIVSTRVPKVSTKVRQLKQTKVQKKVSHEAFYYDPVAQTFQVSATGGSEEGVFLKELEVFFKTKDARESVEAYLVTTEGQVPTDKVIPHSHIVKTSDTRLRIVVENLVGNTVTIPANTTVVGRTSGATGIVKRARTYQSAAANSTTNVDNTVYTLVLDNYVGEFLPNEILEVKAAPANRSTFRIQKDEVLIERLDLGAVGAGYTTASVVMSPPQLPGGVAATATCKVGKGVVYEVELTDPGSGYTKLPTATIVGDGTGAEVYVRIDKRETQGGTAGDPVIMGVATSEDATAATKFKFKAPVYLQPGEYYAFVLKAPTSLDYNVYTAKMGENILGTNRRLTQVTSKGSLFKSQNGGLWTEDQTQDIKFVIHRCKFQKNRIAEVKMNNAPYDLRLVDANPFQTDADGDDLTSRVFGDNPQIVQVTHANHYLQPEDLVAIEGVTEDVGGIPASALNGVHTVVNSDFHTFTINVGQSATETTIGGGEEVAMTYNVAYEVSTLTGGIMNFPSTRFNIKQQGTRAAGNSWNAARRREFLDPVNDLAGQNTFNDYIDPGVKGIERVIEDKFITQAYTPEKEKPVEVDYDCYWPRPLQVPSILNAAYYEDKMGGETNFTNRGLNLDIFMTTQNDYVSPVIDMERMNITCTKNLIDNPKKDEERFGVNFKTLEFSNSIAAAGLNVGDLLSFERGSEPGEVYTVSIKRVDTSSNQVDVKGRNIYKIKQPTTDSTTFTNAALQAAGLDTVSLERGNSFRSANSNDDSAHCQWISRLFEFENPCDGIKLKLSAFVYYRWQLRVFYRPRPVGFSGDLNAQGWKGIDGRQGMPNNWAELDYSNRVRAVNPAEMDPADWTELEWSFQDRAKFDAVQFKIQLRSINPATVPLISDMQVIASE